MPWLARFLAAATIVQSLFIALDANRFEVSLVQPCSAVEKKSGRGKGTEFSCGHVFLFIERRPPIGKAQLSEASSCSRVRSEMPGNRAALIAA